MKTCNKCKIQKQLSEFYKDKKSPDGIDYRCKQCRADYFQQNKSTYRKRTTEWKKNNIERWRQQDSLRQKKRRQEKPHLRRWAVLLERTLRKLNQSKESTTQELLRYSAIDLKQHLDIQGMNWGKDDIDHKVPMTWFIETTPPHIVNDLRNLQPLNSITNKNKSNSFSDEIEYNYYLLILNWIRSEYKTKLKTKRI
jgi:hypothetical protein